MAQLIVAGNATAGQVLAGSTFSAGATTGTSGTMPNNGAVAITPSASSQAIAAGYHNGSGTVAAVTVPAANVLVGTTIAGTAGTMPNRGATSFTPSTGNQAILAGYHNGSGVVSGDPNLIGANINTGITIFGVAGTSTRKRFAIGSGTSNHSGSPKFSIRGLAFQPSVVIMEYYEWDMAANQRKVYYVSPLNFSNLNTGINIYSDGFDYTAYMGSYDFATHWIAIE